MFSLIRFSIAHFFDDLPDGLLRRYLTSCFETGGIFLIQVVVLDCWVDGGGSGVAASF